MHLQHLPKESQNIALFFDERLLRNSLEFDSRYLQKLQNKKIIYISFVFGWTNARGRPFESAVSIEKASDARKQALM